MKGMKSTLIFLLIVPLFMTTKSQKIESIPVQEIDSALRVAFIRDFPAARDIIWFKDGEFTSASFKLLDQKSIVRYDSTNKKIEVETEITKKELPATFETNIKRDFPKYRIKKTTKIEHYTNIRRWRIIISKGGDTQEIIMKIPSQELY